MSCCAHEYFDVNCPRCFDEAKKLDRFYTYLDASVAASRKPESPQPLAPAWASIRFPTHPSDILKLLNDI